MEPISGLAASRRSAIVIAVAVVLALIGVSAIALGAADDDDGDKIASTRTTRDGDGGDGGDTDGDSSDTTTSLLPGATVTTQAGSTGTTARGSTGTTAAPGPGTTVVTAACPAAPAAGADPAATATAPATGTYTYANCTNASDTTESKISAGQSGDGVTRRGVSSSAGGFEQTATIAYSSAGVLLERIVINSPQGKLTCDWNPDVVNYPGQLKNGTTWTAKSSCDLKQENGSSPGKLSIDATGKVTGKVAVNVGGVAVNAWVIESTIKLTTNVAFGSTTVNVSALSHYSPAHGLDVFRHSQTQSQQGTTTRDEHLVSLTPKN
jgi:hypothetical protein